MSEIFKKLQGAWDTRVDNGADQMDVIAKVYEGQLPAEYDKYFPKAAPKHVINMTKLAHNDLATQIGRVPDFQADPVNGTNDALKNAGLRERIAMSYLNHAEPTAQMFMQIAAWYLVGFGRAVVIVAPDDDNNRPTFILRDPRHCKPSFSKTAVGMPVELNDLLFKYEMPRDEAVARGLAKPHREVEARPVKGAALDKIEIFELLDKQAWTIASADGIVKRVEHDLGEVPAWVFQSFSPDGTNGLGLFDDQISLQVAISMAISLKLAAMDRQVNPVYWARGHSGTIKIGGGVINKLSSTGEMGMMAPPVLPQVDRDIDMMSTFTRILNRNPESRQGEIAARGSYTSAKTLEQLSEAIDTVIGQYWDVMGAGIVKLVQIAFNMDQKMWPNMEKSISGVHKGNTFRENYTPAKDIAGNFQIRAQHGFSVGGYQGFLQTLQAHGAGMLPKKRAIETMPGVSDVDQVLREIELEAMDEAGRALFQQQAASGQLDMILWAELRQEMARKGIPLHEVMVKYQERIQEQAVQAQAQGGAEAITAAPGEAQPEEAPLPGLNPAALV